MTANRVTCVVVLEKRSLRERKKSQTHEGLAAAALELFLQHGFDAVTVDEIAAAAGVSPRTFFRYFGSKEAVLFADQDEILGALHASLASRPDHEAPLTAIRWALRDLSDLYVQHRDQHLRRARMTEEGAALGTYQRTVLLPRWEEELTEAIARRTGADPAIDVECHLLAGVAMAAMTSASVAWLASDGRSDIGQLIDHAFDILENNVLRSRSDT